MNNNMKKRLNAVRIGISIVVNIVFSFFIIIIFTGIFRSIVSADLLASAFYILALLTYIVLNMALLGHNEVFKALSNGKKAAAIGIPIVMGIISYGMALYHVLTTTEGE